MLKEKKVNQDALWVDASGLKCPLPILRLKKALATLEKGEVVALLTTDESTTIDVYVFCTQTGHRLLSSNLQQAGAESWVLRVMKCK